MTSIPTITLNTGATMPLLGFGVYRITDLDECERSVSAALEAGYRLIDTAANYGNEEAVGRALAASGIPREEVFITTKLQPQDFPHHRAKASFARSLERLGLDYVDLYLEHMPFNDVYGAWRAMEEAHDTGQARAIGVSNFSAGRLKDLVVNARIVPAVNQVEFHPYSQQAALTVVLDQHDVRLNGWGPFAQGRESLLEDPALTALAERHGKTPAQIVLRWHLQRGVIAIPKSSNPDRMKQNIDVLNFELTDDDISTIDALDQDTYLLKEPHDPQLIAHIQSEAHYTP